MDVTTTEAGKVNKVTLTMKMLALLEPLDVEEQNAVLNTLKNVCKRPVVSNNMASDTTDRI